MTEPKPVANVVTVLMGLGHLRAAYPLRHLNPEGVFIYGSKRNTPEKEYKIWRKIRKSYYFFSRAGKIPLIGNWLLRLLIWIQRIKPYYPIRDHSKPSRAVWYVEHLIRARGLCRALVKKAGQDLLPVIHTHFATAIALEKSLGKKIAHYLLICDTDFNRVWVPRDSRNSSLKYLAPCTQVKRRLQSYGVPEQNIFLTGFPLPKENIGSKTGLEILKKDLFARLLRLDPGGCFFENHQQSILHWLNREDISPNAGRGFTITFAIGGAGAQSDMVYGILKSLREAILDKRIRFVLSVGIQKRVFEQMLGYINKIRLFPEINRQIQIIFDEDPLNYLQKFNACIRYTDLLWTKPSELVFYSGLGLPILLAPAIGTHEELNKRWLEQIHAAVKPAGPLAFCHQWLFDMRESGCLAEAAWDGFLKVRKLGTYKIEQLLSEGTFNEGKSPLEQ